MAISSGRLITIERLVSFVAAVIAISVFITGVQSLREWRKALKSERVDAAERQVAPHQSAAARTNAPEGGAVFVGTWDGYLLTGRPNVDAATGKVTSWTSFEEHTPSEEIIVKVAGDNKYDVTHRRKDGSFQGTDAFTFHDGKLTALGSPYEYYKGSIPTIWRTPDGTFKYIDGVSDLKLKHHVDSDPASFVGLWLIKAENRYLKITAAGSDSFELSSGSATSGDYPQQGAEIQWLPPVGLRLVNGCLEGSPPDFLEGHLTITASEGGELRYLLDFGGGNRKTLIAKRIVDFRGG
jgi:hypothetical protein